MSSQRFPNKVLYRVAGKPMLQYLLERLNTCSNLDVIIVATSVEPSDDAIVEFCQQYGISCYRGQPSNVASRFKEASETHALDAFIRVNGDSPLLDQRLIEKGIGIFLNGDFDLVTNVLPRTYPKGQSVEVLRTSTYQRTYPRMQESDDLEHVTKFFYKHPKDFRIHNFALAENLNNIQLSVDTWQDMDNFVTIVAKMSKPHWEYALEDILEIYYNLS